MEEFKKLGIIEPILKVIEQLHFEKPSAIQEKSIPLIVQGKDVIAGSATGSGKTLAFSAGIIQTCESGKGIQALVLTPTRELAEQVAKSIRDFAKYKKLSVATIFGGVSINPQMDELRKADVVVGTPGRLLDHLGRNTLKLLNIKILVLDEADRMLDMGFIDDVEEIIRACNKNRQTLLFSATISGEIADLSHRYMKNPVKITGEPMVDPRKLRQVYYDIADNMKFSLLVHLLKHENADLVMVFCNTQKTTDFVANNLKSLGIDALAIHGGFTQAKRSSTMKQFHAGKICVLVCTDVAGRGLDISGVSHVYNYDSSKESKQYIHRIGRTARAGKEGIAINLVSSRDHENFGRILRDNHLEMPKVPTPTGMERVQITWKEEPEHFGRGGGGRGGGYGGGGHGRGGGRQSNRSTSRGGWGRQ